MLHGSRPRHLSLRVSLLAATLKYSLIDYPAHLLLLTHLTVAHPDKMQSPNDALGRTMETEYTSNVIGTAYQCSTWEGCINADSHIYRQHEATLYGFK